MTAKEKKEFVSGLITNAQIDILKRLEKTPDDWDGIELRWFIRDWFSTIVFGDYTDRRSKRYRDYSNEVIIKNLI